MLYRCSSGFNLQQYPGDMEVAPGVLLEGLNTQAAEQFNAILERVRTQVSYMLHDNAVDYLKYFLSKCNDAAIARVRQAALSF